MFGTLISTSQTATQTTKTQVGANAKKTYPADLVEQGVRSVVLLTSDKELRHYDPPTVDVGGLRSLYHTAGLQTVHFPFDDPAHDLTAKAAFGTAVDELATEIAHALRGLAPPAVLHCSAAIDRSPPIAARIAFLAEVDAL